MTKYVFFAILAAALYALNAPFSAMLLTKLPSAMTAGLLYIGAGVGMAVVLGFSRIFRKTADGDSVPPSLDRSDLKYVVCMILLDIAAPIFFMYGIRSTGAAAASLLNNFEIVATAVIALILFREKISCRLWGAIGLITASCMLLSIESEAGIRISAGALYVIAACICWGFENNCTASLSKKNPIEIVTVKGIFSGIGSIAVSILSGERPDFSVAVFGALLLGFVAYGLSIYFYVKAQAKLGAAKTSAYYAVSPFIGGALSLIIAQKLPSVIFLSAVVLMAFGTILTSKCVKF